MGMLLLNGSTDFNPRTLFSNNEQGLWLDPSDMTAGKAGWRRNLVTYSEQFDNAAWTKVNISINQNTTIAPDGTVSADTVTTSDTANNIRNAAGIQVVAGQTYTFSFYALRGTMTDIKFSAFDLTNSTNIVAPTSYYSQINASTWTRVSFSFVIPANCSQILVYPCRDSGSTGTAFIWGAQLELGSTPTEYQPITDFSTEFKQAFPTHTLYQDSNGVTPCTAAGDPVGLIIDQSRGGLGALGPELWTNPTPTISNNAGSNGAYDSGTSTMTNSGSTATGYPRFSFNLGLTAGKFYRVTGLLTGNISKITNPRLALSGASNNVGYNTATGVISGVTQAGSGGSIEFVTDLTSSESLTIASISIREVPGNHAYQTTSASRPTLARIPSSGRRNLLTYSEQFDNAAWTKDNSATVTANSTTAPEGTATADTITAGTTGTFRQVRQLFALSSGNQRTFTCYLKAGTTNVAYLLASDMIAHADGRYFDLANGTLGGQTGLTVGSTVTLNDSSVESVGSGWYRCRITVTVSASTTFSFLIGIADANNSATSTANKTILAWGAQLETGSTATNYQKVGSTHDVSESGFSDLYHLSFDGSDDSLTTNSVDMTGTAQMTVIAAVRKLSDAARGIICELSASVGANPASFLLDGPGFSSTDSFSLIVRGDGSNRNFIDSGNPFPAPVSVVLTANIDFALPANDGTLRANGVQRGVTPDDTGAGNFGNYQLFIGRRNQASNPFNGHIYQLIIRGRTTPTGKLLEAERFVARKTGVTGI